MDTALPDGPRGRVLALALTLTVLAALWLGCVQPLLAWHATRADALAQRDALLQRMTMLVATLPELQREASGEHAATSALLAGASDAIAGATLQTTVQGMAATAGATLRSLETLPAEPRGQYHRIALRVSTEVSWPVLVTLLRAIEQGPPRMLVDNLQLRAPPEEQRTADSPITAAFTIVAFRAATPGGT
jgi:general secretion pathway protein M